MVHFLLAVDTMDYGPWFTFRCYTHVLISWTIFHGQLSVDHTLMLIPWTIVHGPLSIGNSRQSILLTIFHGPLSIGHTRV